MQICAVKALMAGEPQLGLSTMAETPDNDTGVERPSDGNAVESLWSTSVTPEVQGDQ